MEPGGSLSPPAEQEQSSEKVKGDEKVDSVASDGSMTREKAKRIVLNVLKKTTFRHRLRKFVAKKRKEREAASASSDGSSKPQKRTMFRSPFVPTCLQAVALFLDLANVGPADTVVDIGSGDGRVVIAAARRGATALGFEIETHLHKRGLEAVADLPPEAQRRITLHNAPAEGEKLVKAVQSASVVFFFLLPEAMRCLVPVLQRHLRPGARIVSYTFKLAGWSLTPVKTVEYKSNVTPLRLYIAPGPKTPSSAPEIAGPSFDPRRSGSEGQDSEAKQARTKGSSEPTL